MKIGLDARMYGLKHAGIGRYVLNLVDQLAKVEEHRFTLFVRQADLVTIKKKYRQQFEYKVADWRHYSWQEQLCFPRLLAQSDCQLIHFPHFNVPLFCPKPFVVTIHDLTKHFSRGKQTTTRAPAAYWFKYVTYQLVFRHAVRQAKHIFTPTEFVKNQLIDRYQINTNKVTATYEGASNKFFSPRLTRPGRAIFQFSAEEIEKILQELTVKPPFLLYVGSAYPHKNLPRLIKGVKLARRDYPQLQLIIVSARNAFLKKLQQKVADLGADDFVSFTGFVTDKQLAALYQSATAFVFPSLSEGFGLPGLEAMTSGCPVIASQASCLPEVYDQAALYFDPDRPEEIAQQIKRLKGNPALRKALIQKGFKQAQKYSWEKMVEKIIKEYKLY